MWPILHGVAKWCCLLILCGVDIYVSCVSSTHCVSSKGFYLALVATTVETGRPEQELKPGLDLLEPIKEKCVVWPSCLMHCMCIVLHIFMRLILYMSTEGKTTVLILS